MIFHICDMQPGSLAASKSFSGDRYVLHPAVDCIRRACHIALLLQPLDDSSSGRLCHMEYAFKLLQGQLTFRGSIQFHQDMHLRKGQILRAKQCVCSMV